MSNPINRLRDGDELSSEMQSYLSLQIDKCVNNTWNDLRNSSDQTMVFISESFIRHVNRLLDSLNRYDDSLFSEELVAFIRDESLALFSGAEYSDLRSSLDKYFVGLLDHASVMPGGRYENVFGFFPSLAKEDVSVQKECGRLFAIHGHEQEEDSLESRQNVITMEMILAFSGHVKGLNPDLYSDEILANSDMTSERCQKLFKFIDELRYMGLLLESRLSCSVSEIIKYSPSEILSFMQNELPADYEQYQSFCEKAGIATNEAESFLKLNKQLKGFGFSVQDVKSLIQSFPNANFKPENTLFEDLKILITGEFNSSEKDNSALLDKLGRGSERLCLVKLSLLFKCSIGSITNFFRKGNLSALSMTSGLVFQQV